MKRLLTILTMATLTLSMSAQSKLASELGEYRGFSSVYISKAMLRMFGSSGKIDGIGKVSPKAINNLDGIYIFSADESSYIGQLKSVTKKHVDKDKYELLMQNKDGEDFSNIYMREEKKGKRELVLFAGGEDEVSVIILIGDISLEDIQEINK